MPTLLGAAVLVLGGVLVLRVARREWKRVNTDLEAQRRTEREGKDAPRLEKDPQTGTYRPRE